MILGFNTGFVLEDSSVRVEGVGTRAMYSAIGGLFASYGCFVNGSVVYTLRATESGRDSPMNGDMLSRVVRGSGVTTHRRIPLYRSANVTILFIRCNSGIIVRSNDFSRTIGRNIHETCVSNCLHGDMMGSPIFSEVGAGSGAPTVVRAGVIDKGRVGVATNNGNFNDRGVSRVGVLAPSGNVRNIGRFVLSAIFRTNPGPYPPVIIKIKVNNAFRETTRLTGGTAFHPVSSGGRSRHCTRLRSRLLTRVGGVKFNPTKLNNGAATVNIGVRASPARVTKVPITIGVYYRTTERTDTAV